MGRMALLMSGFRGNSLKAIRLSDAKGDITGHARGRVDARPRHAIRPVAAPLRQHPVLPEDEQRPAVGVRRQDRDTALLRRMRLEAVPNVFASPVGAAGRVYIAGREGKTVVLRHGPKLEVARRQRAQRWLRRVTGARGQRNLPARIQVPVLYRFGDGSLIVENSWDTPAANRSARSPEFSTIETRPL